MAHLSIANSATLVKDHNFVLSIDEDRELVRIQYKDVRVQGFPLGPNHKSIFIDVISKYLKEPKGASREAHQDNLLSLWVGKSDRKVSFQLDTDFLKNISRILPNPFLQIVIHGEIHIPDGVVRVSESKSFLLQDALRQGYDIGHGQVSFGELTLSNLRPFCSADLFCDIKMGWTEPILSLVKATPTPAYGDSFMQNLYKCESSKDLVIVAGNKAEIKCHRLVFEGRSLVLSAMLSPNNGMKESQKGRVELRENSEDGVTHLVKYMYCIDTTPEMSCDVAVELFLAAHKYDLSHLESSLGEMLLDMDVEWFSPDAILELYFFTGKLSEFGDLQDHALRIMTGMNNDELRTCERFQQLESMEAVNLLGKIIALSQKFHNRGNKRHSKNNVRSNDSVKRPDGFPEYMTMFMAQFRKYANMIRVAVGSDFAIPVFILILFISWVILVFLSVRDIQANVDITIVKSSKFEKPKLEFLS